MTDINSKAVVLSTARTPFGKLGGALAPLNATSLGAVALAAAIERAGVDPTDVEHAVFGEVLQAGVGQNPARQVVFKAGLAKTVTADTVNKVCASGLLAVVNAMRSINAGANSLVAAGGMESMSNAPYLLRDARWGYRFGDGALIDAMIYDGLWDQYFPMTMSTQGNKVAAEMGLSREDQDRFAYESHRRAHESHSKGHFADEIVPVRVASKAKGKVVVDKLPRRGEVRVPASVGAANRVWDHEPSQEFTMQYEEYAPFVTGDVPHVVVDRDEAVRADASLEAMAKLKPLDKGGTVTAANAPGVNDGAAALIVADAQWAAQRGYEALATIVDHATVAWDSPYICLTPAMAASKLLDRAGLRHEDIAVWEINEAFSAVAITSARNLGLDESHVNKFGGAVAMGHPIGASGARLVGTVINQLRKRGGGYGIATICSGGGQGDALLVRVG
ncbi:MAG: thiolase family protein [Candidatus Eremiobacteraeota bacterium]|nr:thiolase family protein [Candidatus Eremiobacteraeota bacterium]MBV8331245.1 thiolase family protein [Candidatus Eremiobacteraeota bacterium]MBV8434746.1 thiolase family protein [Candidatus Eremiobacteraeota bacterium]MBV8583208.1 thiolase family protein [Candidatus Eremiobacteraeota bacterium]